MRGHEGELCACESREWRKELHVTWGPGIPGLKQMIGTGVSMAGWHVFDKSIIKPKEVMFVLFITRPLTELGNTGPMAGVRW